MAKSPTKPENASSGAAGETLEAFMRTIAHLRSPQGCPWDREQTHTSIARNLVEESYEAVDAIDRNDLIDLQEELGDVLLQVVLQSQIASEQGAFSLVDVIAAVNEKMLRRHPHVFGDEAAFAAAGISEEQLQRIKAAQTPGKVLHLWDSIKLAEKQHKAARKCQLRPQDPPDLQAQQKPQNQQTFAAEFQAQGEQGALLDDVPLSLPALMQAQDISRKAVSVGFEWPDVASVWNQVFLEIEEYRAEDKASEAAAQEFGDILFSLVNVARKEGIDAESALRLACRKFRDRWAIMEQSARKEKKHLSEYSVDELEAFWQDAKRQGLSNEGK